MKNFLQNLLIFFAFCLCALIAFQWVRETNLRKDIQKLNDTVHDKLETIQTLQGAVKRDDEEIQRLDSLKNQLTATVKTNQLEISRLTKDLEKVEGENERNLKQIEVYKDAVQKANENIARQNEEIKTQNEAMKKLAEDNNETVLKFNKLAADYKDLVDKWNKQQADLSKSATNSAAKK
jgi:septal ring factor EnvC (AmiA/AmiB activator)